MSYSNISNFIQKLLLQIISYLWVVLLDCNRITYSGVQFTYVSKEPRPQFTYIQNKSGPPFTFMQIKSKSKFTNYTILTFYCGGGGTVYLIHRQIDRVQLLFLLTTMVNRLPAGVIDHRNNYLICLFFHFSFKLINEL